MSRAHRTPRGLRAASLLGLLLTALPAAHGAELTPAAARWTSAGVTLGSLGVHGLGLELDDTTLQVVGALGTLAGPSAGHLRAGEWGHALLTSSLRTGALTYGMLTLGTEYDCMEPEVYVDQGWNDRGPCRKTTMDLVAGWSALGAWIGLTGFDLYDAGRAPVRVAERRARRQAPAVRLSPRLPTDPEGTWGLQLDGSF